MLCRICNEDKLSQEFIPYSITPECKHQKLICLRCAIRAADNGMCPFSACEQPIDKRSYQVKEFRLMLDFLFTEIDEDEDLPSIATYPRNSIRVVRITGESNVFTITNTTTVSHLKFQIAKELKIQKTQQVLVCNGREIKEIIHGTSQLITDYVKPGGTVILMVLLYSVPAYLDHVKFDLTWNYPMTKKDYLDGSCLVYNGPKFVQYVDFSNTFMAPADAVTGHKEIEQRGVKLYSVKVDENQRSIDHSSDYLLDDVKKNGKHTIDVYLKRLPFEVTHLFFVLSAWEHPTISHFPNPSLRFYEASNPTENLCETTFTHALDSSAVIMCSLTRVGCEWRVMRSGALSSGNAKNYNPMNSKVIDLIYKGQC